MAVHLCVCVQVDEAHNESIEDVNAVCLRSTLFDSASVANYFFDQAAIVVATTIEQREIE